VNALLAAAPGLKVLAASRAPLHIYGEHEYSVPPMEVPDLRSLALNSPHEAVGAVGPSVERLGRSRASQNGPRGCWALWMRRGSAASAH
jgi:predicted ATPase